MPRKKTNETYKGVGRGKSSVEHAYMTPGTDFSLLATKLSMKIYRKKS